MPSFIRDVDGAFINLDRIEKISPKEQSDIYFATVAGEDRAFMIDGEDLFFRPIEFVPAPKGTEILRWEYDSDGVDFWVDSVILWGITIDGSALPITAESDGVVTVDYAVIGSDGETFFIPSGGIYEGKEAIEAYLLSSRAEAKAAKATP